MLDHKSCKVIAVVGPTASGKTELAVKIAQQALEQQQMVTVFSLDSRQIYRELPLISCADVEVWQELQTKYPQHLRVKNLADKSVAQIWSVGQTLTEFTAEWQRLPANGMMIAVGGSLMYQRRLRGDSDWTQIPPNDNVRFAAENMSLERVQAWLQRVDAAAWEQLNESDRANSRRLVRKIEIAFYVKIYQPQMEKTAPWGTVTTVQPQYKWEEIEDRIWQRVRQRWSEAVIAEVAQVQRRYPQLVADEQWQSRMPLWWQEISRYLAGKIDEATCQRGCALRDWQYAKKQRTWLKKLLSDETNLVNEGEVVAD